MSPQAPEPVPPELEAMVRLATQALNEHTNQERGLSDVQLRQRLRALAGGAGSGQSSLWPAGGPSCPASLLPPAAGPIKERGNGWVCSRWPAVRMLPGPGSGRWTSSAPTQMALARSMR